MDRSFSHKSRTGKDGLSMPHPHQFAPTTSSSPFRDPERRRAYIADQEAAYVSMDERLRQIAAAQDRDERVRRAEAREWKDQLDRWSQSPGARRQESGEMYPWSEVGEEYEETEPSPWEASFEAKKVRELPHRERGRLSDGAYERLATTHGSTYGDAVPHTKRLRSSISDEIDRLQQERARLTREVSEILSLRGTDKPFTYPYLERIEVLERIEKRIRDLKEFEIQDFRHAIVDAAKTERYRSHHTKPESPRGDGRTLRGSGWMR
jgi:hypothetical protein